VQGFSWQQVFYLALAGNYAVLNYGVTPDGGATTVTLATYKTGVGSQSISASIKAWSGDTAGTEILASDATTGVLEIFSVAGGSPKVIDPNGNFGVLTPDGAAVVYTSLPPADGGTTTNLERSPVATPSPTVLATGSLLGLYGSGLSPSGTRALVTDSTNINVASAVGAGSLALVGPIANRGYTYFTNDSSHVVFLTNFNVGNSNVGTLNAMPAAGGPATTIAQGVLGWGSSGPTKVVYNDHYATWADIEVVDTAQAVAPKTIVSLAHPTFLLSPAGDQVIYSWSAQLVSAAGIYVTPVP
jgi:hypothetical protein